MKANDAPEKLYLLQHNGLVCYCMSNEDDIEYTRTDALIEKACEFFAPYIPDNSGGYDRARIIEDFKNYMKEE